MGYSNPLLELPAAQRLMALPRELRAEADRKAEVSWRRRKAPMPGLLARHVDLRTPRCARAAQGRQMKVRVGIPLTGGRLVTAARELAARPGLLRRPTHRRRAGLTGR